MGRNAASSDRAVSEVLGYALVFSLVLATVGVVTVAGVSQLEAVRDAERMENAERAFDLLAANVNDVALRGAPSRSTEIRAADAGVDVARPITVGVRAVDDDGADFGEVYDIWPIHYRAGDAAVVYSAGAVFRTSGDASVMVRRPEIVADDGRLVVPLVQTRSRGAQSRAGGTVRIRADRATVDRLASDARNAYDTVFLNVTSPRAAAWAAGLEYDGLDCTVDASGATDRAVCVATAPERLHVALIRIDLTLSG